MKNLISMIAFTSMSLVMSAQSFQDSGLNLSNFDKNVSPKTDFFEYACGGWIKNNPLPNAYSRFGSFEQLQMDNTKRVNEIITDLLKKNYKSGSVEQKLSDLYRLAMDSDRQNHEGVRPISELLNNIKKAKDKQQLFVQHCVLGRFGMQMFLNMNFGTDDKNSNQNIMNIYQGGLTLVNKEYYLDNDASTMAIREAYKKHIAKMFRLSGFSEKEALQNMSYVMKVETSLAGASKSNTELRDVEANYNKRTIGELIYKYPHVQWLKYFNAIGIDSKYVQTLIVGQPNFLKQVDELISRLTLAEYKAVMEWYLINDAAPYLGDKFATASFDFYGKVMKGRKNDYPRWQKAVSTIQSMMGEALGKMYTDRYFPESSKVRMEHLVANLQESLKERIQAQEWMSDTTKMNAIDKLNHFYVKIGYPKTWKDYSKLIINPSESYYENILKCDKFLFNYSIEKRAGKPVDREEWHMTPQTVNAYYNPSTNEICFPAGILQKPFFDPNADDAFNYGAIGVVIGHEMTHGFDDQGRHYDKNGNMKDWWTEHDAKQFALRAQVLSDYFSNINVLSDLKANGALTLGENLADHGGLQVSFNAFKEAMKKTPLSVINGFTPEQRFFIAYAGVWANNITDKEIRSRTKSDPHSLGRWRVDASLPHIEAWYEAFGVQPSDKMFIPKDKRLSLW
jgi:putative endopeptidase